MMKEDEVPVVSRRRAPQPAQHGKSLRTKCRARPVRHVRARCPSSPARPQPPAARHRLALPSGRSGVAARAIARRPYFWLTRAGRAPVFVMLSHERRRRRGSPGSTPTDARSGPARRQARAVRADEGRERRRLRVGGKLAAATAKWKRRPQSAGPDSRRACSPGAQHATTELVALPVQPSTPRRRSRVVTPATVNGGQQRLLSRSESAALRPRLRRCRCRPAHRPGRGLFRATGPEDGHQS